MVDVQLPDGSIARFPDSMADADIEAVLQKEHSASMDKALSDSEAAFISGLGAGASFNANDEMLAGLGAGFAGTVLTGTNALGLTDVENPYETTYNSGLERQRKNIKDAAEASPVSFIAGNIAGAIGTGFGGAGFKGVKALSDSVRSGGLVARATKGGVVGAATASAYGFGRGEGGLEQRLNTAAEDARWGAAGGVAAPIIAKTVGGTVRGTADLLKKKAPVLSYEDVSAMSSAKYAEAEKLGGVLKPEITDKWLGKIQNIQRISPQAQPLQTAAEKEIFNSIDELIAVNKGKPLSLQAAQDIDERLGERISALYKDGLPKKANALSDAQLALREAIKGATDADTIGGKAGFEAWKEGQFLFSRSRALRDVERVIENAAMYDQPATAIKTGLRTIARNPKRMRGFNKEERLLIKKASESSAPMDLLRTMGSRLNPIIAMGATGNPAYAVATKVGSDLSRSAGEALQARRAGKVLQAISDDVRGYGKSSTPNTTPLAGAIPAASVSGHVNQPQTPTSITRSAVPAMDELGAIPPAQRNVIPYAPEMPPAIQAPIPAAPKRAPRPAAPQKQPRINQSQLAAESKARNLAVIDEAFMGQLPEENRAFLQNHFKALEDEKQELLSMLKGDAAKTVASEIDNIYAGKAVSGKMLNAMLKDTAYSGRENAPRVKKLIESIYKSHPREMGGVRFSDKPIEYQMRRPDGGVTNYRINPTLPSLMEFKRRMASLPKDRFLAIGGAGVAGAYATDSEASNTPLTLEITPQSTTFTAPSINGGMEYTEGHEGYSPTVYYDTTGNPTVGKGFNLNSGIAPRVWRKAGLSPQLYNKVKRGEAQLSQYDSDLLLQTSYEIADSDARAYYPDFDKLSQEQRIALTDMSYQMGGSTLRQFKGLHKALKSGDKNAIVKSVRNSRYYKQTPERATKNINLLLQGN